MHCYFLIVRPHGTNKRKTFKFDLTLDFDQQELSESPGWIGPFYKLPRLFSFGIQFTWWLC